MLSNIYKNIVYLRGPMKSIDLFMQFFRREGWIYAIGLTMLIAIDVAFLFVPQFIGNAIDTLSNNKEGLVNYIFYFIGLYSTYGISLSRNSM